MNSDARTLKKILLVEDDPRDVKLTLTALEDHHLANKVLVVQDGEQALDYLYRRGKFKTREPGNPILVLLDNKMPKVNGLEVLRAMKAGENLKTIPVVALTSSRETSDLVEFYNHGVNACVVKSVDFSEFMKALNEPPPPTGREEPWVQGGALVPPGKKEVDHEISAPHSAPGG